MFSEILVSKVYRSVLVKNDSLWTEYIILIDKPQIIRRSYFNILTQKYMFRRNENR